MMSRMRMPMAAVAVAAVLLIPAAGASGAGLSFTTPAQLPHGDPSGTPYYGGGEPSVAFDPNGDGHVYVTAPQGIPAAVGGILGVGSSAGVAYWASDDAGLSWPKSGITGSGAGGGDSDVEVLGDHKVLVADLEAAATAICSSTDFAKTFPDCGGGIDPNQQGPENDREWLTRGAKPGEVYLTYHDFAGGFPIIERSTDGGQTFSPCGTIIDPAGPAAQTYTPAGGTLVSKPLVGPDGTVYVEFTTPDQTAPPVGAKLNHLYMAVAKGGCTGTTVFTDHVIYQDPGADLARIFQASARDAGGNLYVLAGGQTKAGQTDSGLYLFTSTDDGKTWSAPAKVNPPAAKANVFPAIAGGPGKGEVVFGWFGTETSGDPNTQTNQWRFYAAESLDGGQTIATTTVSPDPLHYGDICTQGVFCGLIPGQPGNRNLADFASVAVNPADGCPAFAIPGDPYNRPDLPSGQNTNGSSAYISVANGKGACLTKGEAGKPATTIGSGSGSGSGGSGGSGTTCLDRAAPVVKVGSARHAGRRLRLRGTASDRGCATGGKGKVARVQVAIAEQTGKQCRFVTPTGRLAAQGSCAKRRFLNAKGASTWTLTVRRKLPAGRYVVVVRGRDASGNVSRARSARAVRLR
jgi:hypothetical protein